MKALLDPICSQLTYTPVLNLLHLHLPTIMQATNRTHVLRFAGPAYELQGRVELPYETSFDVLYGAGAVEREPVSPGALPMPMPACIAASLRRSIAWPHHPAHARTSYHFSS